MNEWNDEMGRYKAGCMCVGDYGITWLAGLNKWRYECLNCSLNVV